MALLAFALVAPPPDAVQFSSECSFSNIARRFDFSDSAYLGPFAAFSSWHIELEDPRLGRRTVPVKLCLRHSTFTRKWCLLMDGSLRATGKIKSNTDKVTDEDEADYTLLMQLGGSTELRLTISRVPNSSTFKYTLTDSSGLYYKEIRTLTDTETTIGNSQRPVDVQIASVKKRLLETSSSSSSSSSSGAKEEVNVYEVSFQINSKAVSISRRYCEFAMLDSMIRSQTRKHMLSTIPTLPGKVFNPFTNQTSEKFLEQRRRSLEQFLANLVNHEKVFSFA
jgi:hypothetical protein